MSSVVPAAARETEDRADDEAPPPHASAPVLPKARSPFHDPRVRRVLLWLAVGLTALLAVWWFHFRPYVSSEDARVAAPVAVVATQATGRVERVLVREGQQVGAGEPLVELDASSERAQVERARALVALAEARVGEAEVQLSLERRLVEATEQRAQAGVKLAQAAHRKTVVGARPEELTQARADLAAAAVVAEQTRQDLTRAEALSRNGAMTIKDLEAARTAATSAAAALERRGAALDLLEHGARPEDVSIAWDTVLQAQANLSEAGAGSERVALRTRQVEEARAQAAQARAELSIAEVALARMTLASSVAGTVVRVSVDPGDSLSPNQGAVTVVDLAHAWIAANVEETETARLRPGQPVHVSIDEGGELSGTVEVVTQAAASQFALIPADNAAGNFTKVVQRIPIRISIDDPERASSLRVGQSVVVRIRVR